MREIYRILDASFNRVREALRVVEDCGRFALNDPAITAMAKNLRSDLKEILDTMPTKEFIAARDTAGDIGTAISSPTETKRDGLPDVVTAACKRLGEALRSIEEYSKFVSPGQTLRIERMRYDTYTLEQRMMNRLSVGSRFASVKLYVLITRKLCRGSVREVARAAIAGGADAIQLREKGVSDAEFLAMAAELRELTDEMGKLLIINDRPDVAAIVGADGVHLGQHDLPIAESRRLLRPGAIVGRSTHTIEQAHAAINEGADYIGVGPMFQTTTKDVYTIAGPLFLKQATEAIKLPIVAIGGINADNIGQLIVAGAKCVAVSAAVCSADDPQAAARTIRSQLP